MTEMYLRDTFYISSSYNWISSFLYIYIYIYINFGNIYFHFTFPHIVLFSSFHLALTALGLQSDRLPPVTVVADIPWCCNRDNEDKWNGEDIGVRASTGKSSTDLHDVNKGKHWKGVAKDKSHYEVLGL